MLLYSLPFSFLLSLFMETPSFFYPYCHCEAPCINLEQSEFVNTQPTHAEFTKRCQRHKTEQTKLCFTGTGNVLMLDSKSIKRCRRDDLIMQIKLSTQCQLNSPDKSARSLFNRINCSARIWKCSHLCHQLIVLHKCCDILSLNWIRSTYLHIFLLLMHNGEHWSLNPWC